MGRSRGFILIGMAVLMATLTSFLIYKWLEKQRVVLKPIVPALQTEMVVLATTDLLWGTELTAEMLMPVPFPNQNLPQGSFSTVEDLQGRVLIAHVVANEPILEAKLAPVDVTTGGIAAITDLKKRAMAVKVDDVVGVAGFINPGNKVDVLVTLRRKPPITKTVLENVLVLATGSEIERKGKEGKPQRVRVITVEVDPEEGEKLALAANEGKLQLALRNHLASEPVLTSGATIPALLSSYRFPNKVVRRKKATAPEPELPATKVEVIHGSAVSTFTFKEERR